MENRSEIGRWVFEFGSAMVGEPLEIGEVDSVTDYLVEVDSQFTLNKAIIYIASELNSACDRDNLYAALAAEKIADGAVDRGLITFDG